MSHFKHSNFLVEKSRQQTHIHEAPVACEQTCDGCISENSDARTATTDNGEPTTQASAYRTMLTGAAAMTGTSSLRRSSLDLK